MRTELEFSPGLRNRLKHNSLLVVWGDTFKIVFKCDRCEKWVEPSRVIIGPHHLRATHCGIGQEIAVTA
jgi:hypothetical protein